MFDRLSPYQREEEISGQFAAEGQDGPFGRLLAQYQQPSITMLDPAMARQLFLRDVANVRRVQRSTQADQQRGRGLAADLAEQDFTSSRYGYGHLQPGGAREILQVRRAAAGPSDDGTRNHTGYMLQAMARDSALASYDRNAAVRSQLRAAPVAA